MLDVNKTPLQFPECSRSLPIFYRWVTIFVAHFLAKRTLEFQSALLFRSSPDTFQKPIIKVLAVNSEEYSVPHWDEFKRVIREAFAVSEKGLVDDIINILEEKVKGGLGLAHDAHRSLFHFRNIMKGKMKTCRLRMHCEAVLAALLEARQRAPTDAKLERLSEFYKVLGLVCFDVNVSFTFF
jgi:hypothetical protein